MKRKLKRQATRKNPYVQISEVRFIRFYEFLTEIQDGVIRMSLYRRVLKGLNIKFSGIAEHILITKYQLLDAAKFNLIHIDERNLRNKILKISDNILFDILIPNDGWGR